MLELKQITKDYIGGDTKVQALKGINLKFRKNEFVSILGQSGCGKTTLLNIVGGLDQYTSGDLVINDKSTKDFNDRDWDTYRNHSVGFVFQNYNLIPHQTVLANVELALTLAGMSKEERRKKAIKALEDVGLKDQLYKKPNQMSGGQMQRVAIARALVSDPDILLADEPTGALDSKTSVQIMDLLKKIAKNKLVIMVTHNPELAEEYSTRIIKLLDGKVVDDSNPYDGEGEEKKKSKKHNKTFMSYFTALSLSLNNLMTKKGRTILTSFAGSIGIIGIALILSLSNGMQRYIDKIEEETLSSYPITLEESSIDMSDMLQTVMGISNDDVNGHEDNKIYSKTLMTNLISMMSSKVTTNNLKDFKTYLESDESNISDFANEIDYTYNLNLNIYNTYLDGSYVQVSPNQIFSKLGFDSMGTTSSAFMSSTFVSNEVWTELFNNKDLLASEYDVLAGTWPTNYNEVVLIVDENKELTDYTLYSLGLFDQNELIDKYNSLLKGEEVTESEQRSYTYEELLNTKFKLVLNTAYYEKEGNVWVDKSSNEEYMQKILSNALEIKVVGIIKPNEDSVSMVETGKIGYTSALEEYVINEINNSEIAKEQVNNPNINIFTGMEFSNNSNNTFDYNSLSDEQKIYISSLSEEELALLMTTYSNNSSATYQGNLEKLGIVNLDSPSAINIYPKDFDSKEKIASSIEEYNKKQTNASNEENVITYTDMIGTMMKSVTSIINIISYVLMAFVSISLVVSSIMIGIITYISVLERTKEIGILRSIGASKKDITRVFNAETMIIGLTAGVLGIVITLALNVPINIIIKNITGVSNISSLPFMGAIILITISVVLTVVAGLIPSKVAAKKDPVVALRTE